jgi:acetyltransferase-like isoleucine patch superfamily enzyme
MVCGAGAGLGGGLRTRPVLCISPTARISPLADIEDSARGSRIVIADDVVIDAFVKIKPAGGCGDLVIGAGSVINSGCVLYTGHGIRIGSNVLVAANCTFAPTNHAFADPGRPIRTQGFQPSRGGIRIGDDVWIGASTVLVDGATIGSGSVIGAASLVRGPLPDFCIAFGVPAAVHGWRRAPLRHDATGRGQAVASEGAASCRPGTRTETCHCGEHSPR